MFKASCFFLGVGNAAASYCQQAILLVKSDDRADEDDECKKKLLMPQSFLIIRSKILTQTLDTTPLCLDLAI